MENKLQSDIVLEFSARYPLLRGQFFHVPNQRNHQLQAMQARSLGIFPGVADLLYFKEYVVHGFTVENVCKLIALEVKESGSTHKLDHVRQQYEWGEILERAGGKYVIVMSVEQAMEAVNDNFTNCMSLKDLKIKIDNCKSKTIKF
jgi:hypothetical protein